MPSGRKIFRSHVVKPVIKPLLEPTGTIVPVGKNQDWRTSPIEPIRKDQDRRTNHIQPVGKNQDCRNQKDSTNTNEPIWKN